MVIREADSEKERERKTEGLGIGGGLWVKSRLECVSTYRLDS